MNWDLMPWKVKWHLWPKKQVSAHPSGPCYEEVAHKELKKNCKEGDEETYWEERCKISSVLKSSVILTEVHTSRKRHRGLSQESPQGRRRVWLVTWAEYQAWMSLWRDLVQVSTWLKLEHIPNFPGIMDSTKMLISGAPAGVPTKSISNPECPSERVNPVPSAACWRT